MDRGDGGDNPTVNTSVNQSSATVTIQCIYELVAVFLYLNVFGMKYNLTGLESLRYLNPPQGLKLVEFHRGKPHRRIIAVQF